MFNAPMEFELLATDSRYAWLYLAHRIIGGVQAAVRSWRRPAAN